MRILVTGSRDWDDRRTIGAALSYLYAFAHQSADLLTVVHGDARGADRIARDWVAFMVRQGARVSQEPHPVTPRDWNTIGKSAGHQRNQKMVDLGANVCVAFNRNDSSGTRGCADKARDAGIHVWYHVYGYIAPPPPTRFELKLNQ
jgi:hypothetical protein